MLKPVGDELQDWSDVQIEVWDATGNKRQLVIPGIAQAEIEAINGIRGGNATIDNPPLCVVTSDPAVVSRSTRYQYRDYDKDWKFTDRNGFYSPFTYQP